MTKSVLFPFYVFPGSLLSRILFLGKVLLKVSLFGNLKATTFTQIGFRKGDIILIVVKLMIDITVNIYYYILNFAFFKTTSYVK